MDTDARIDMVMCMYNDKDRGIFQFAENLKTSENLSGRGIPFVLLTHFSKEIHRRLEKQDRSYVDYIFSWNGNAELIVAIIKLFEDLENADNDILNIGVQAILLVEDSVRYYSTYLHGAVQAGSQAECGIPEGDAQRKAAEAQETFKAQDTPRDKLRGCGEHLQEIPENMLGIISDVGFVLHKNDLQETEKADAGIDLVKLVREDDPFMPIILQSLPGGHGRSG